MDLLDYMDMDEKGGRTGRMDVIRRGKNGRMGWVGRVDDHISGWSLDGLHDGRDFHDDEDEDEDDEEVTRLTRSVEDLGGN